MSRSYSFVCDSGHASRWYIKTDPHGPACPECYAPVRLVEDETPVGDRYSIDLSAEGRGDG